MNTEEKVRQQMTNMLADQWYHQPGPTLTMAREAIIDMLTKQTLHGMSIGHDKVAADIKLLVKFIQENAAKNVFVDIEQAKAADNVARWLNEQQEAAQTI